MHERQGAVAWVEGPRNPPSFSTPNVRTCREPCYKTGAGDDRVGGSLRPKVPLGCAGQNRALFRPRCWRVTLPLDPPYPLMYGSMSSIFVRLDAPCCGIILSLSLAMNFHNRKIRRWKVHKCDSHKILVPLFLIENVHTHTYLSSASLLSLFSLLIGRYAKNAATYGEYVQSSNGTGYP